MNIAFGNKIPEKVRTDGEILSELRQAIRMAKTEFDEFDEAFTTRNVDEAADAVADAIIFLVGGLFKSGIDPIETIDLILAGIMTRFVKDEADEEATYAKYEREGLPRECVSVEGEYPFRVFRVKTEISGFECQKFLKSNSAKKPTPWKRDGVNLRDVVNKKLDGLLASSGDVFKLPQKRYTKR